MENVAALAASFEEFMPRNENLFAPPTDLVHRSRTTKSLYFRENDRHSH